MKKVLIASTALVAATMFSGAASASEKIKLELGGYSKWWVVGQWQENKFQNATQSDYNNVDVKGDNEVFFGGSTTLDNGMKVGINVELEAGGHTDQTSDPIDKSSVYLESGFGKVILGSEANGTALLHVYAPDAAGNNDSDGILTGGFAIVRPQNSAITRFTTSIDTDDNSEKITYVAPSFYGLTLGASYVPNVGREDTRNTVRLNDNATVAGEAYGVGGLYAKTFGAVDLKVSGGWVTYDVNAHGLGLADGRSKVNEYSTGTQISYAGFTVGGSLRQVNSNANLNGQTGAAQGHGWDAGIQYASGPYAISFIYLEQTAASAAASGDDKFTAYQVSGKYSLGAGVDALASVGHAEFESATGLAQNENKGWAVMTGLSLAF
ncbi:MAG: porin [Bacteroidota bacterium]